jgi:hypothetical protein
MHLLLATRHRCTVSIVLIAAMLSAVGSSNSTGAHPHDYLISMKNVGSFSRRLISSAPRNTAFIQNLTAYCAPCWTFSRYFGHAMDQFATFFEYQASWELFGPKRDPLGVVYVGFLQDNASHV